MIITELNKYNVILICYFFFLNVSSSQTFQDKGVVYSNQFVEIRLQFRQNDNSCYENAYSSFKLNVTKYSYNPYIENKFLTWQLSYVNCNEDTVIKTVSKYISQLEEGGNISEEDWKFKNIALINPILNSHISTKNEQTSDVIKKKLILKVPDYILGPDKVFGGQRIDLEAIGGNAPLGSQISWYSGSCGKNKIGNGKIINIQINSTQTIYARIENGNDKTTCITHKVIVDNNSIEPNSIIGSNKICINQPTTLTIEGGKLGLNAKWAWYKNSIEPNNFISYGQEITVNPEKSTEYFCRAEGTSNNTIPVMFKLNVYNDESSTPEKIIFDNESPCQGQNLKISLVGGKLSEEADWVWYWNEISKTNFIAKSKIGAIDIAPNNTNYKSIIVRAEGYCKNTVPIEKIINFKKESVTPTSINVIERNNNHVKLKVEGGNLGTASNYYWYKNENVNNSFAKGQQIKTTLKKNMKLFVRAEGYCNKTDFLQLSPYFYKRPNLFGNFFINLGFVNNELNLPHNLCFTIGTNKIYFKTKFDIQTFNYNPDFLTNYIVKDGKFENANDLHGEYYRFNNNQKYSRESYTFGMISNLNKFKLYYGLGFGKSILLRSFDQFNYGNDKIIETNWAKLNTSIYMGLEIETGIMITIKNINFLFGSNVIYSRNSNKYSDLNIGLGYTFN